MASTPFTGQVTVIPAEWANDTNYLVYDVFGAAKTKAQARQNLGLGSIAVQPATNVNLEGGIINNVVIGASSAAAGTFTRVQLEAVGGTESDVLDRQATRSLADARAQLLLNTLLPGKGDLLVRGTVVERLPVGENSQVLIANSADTQGMSWGTLTMLAEKNPLDDPENRGEAGDILVRTGTEYTRLPVVNQDDWVLTIDQTRPQKVKWAPGGAGGGAFLEQDVLIIGTDVGAAPEGYTFPLGMSFTEFVIKVSQKVIPPSYGGPSLTLNGSPAPGNFEVGHITDIVLSEAYSAGNAGARTTLSLTRDATQISTTMPFTDLNRQLTLTPFSYSESSSYLQGPCLVNNMGEIDCDGRIPAGTVTSNTLTYVGQRKAFYGTPSSTPAASAAVRALTSDFAANQNSGVDGAGVDLTGSPQPNFTISIPVGATRVVFAYPATLRPVASVRYQELANSEVKGNFVMTLVNVEGANGFTAAQYRVYTYVPIEPFSIANHYRVFI